MADTMTRTASTATTVETMADLLAQLGDIPPERVRMRPTLGTATEQDALDLQAREGRLCELVDGILVEKTVGLRESYLAIILSHILLNFVSPRKLGIVTGADGMMRLTGGLVRIPDVAFIAWERLPGRRLPSEPIPDVAPNLAVEVLSPGNTPGEMARKRREYFTAGVRLGWLVDPRTRTVAVYTAPEPATVLSEAQTLDGGDVLPGLMLPLGELFAELDQHGA